MKKTFFYAALIVLSVAVLIYSCSKGYNNPTPNPGVNGSATVTIQNMAFTPDTVRIATGGTVTWTNMDGMAHTVTSLSGTFDSGSIAQGLTFSYTFAAAGTYTYHCTLHPTMKAAVVIVANASSGY